MRRVLHLFNWSQYDCLILSAVGDLTYSGDESWETCVWWGQVRCSFNLEIDPIRNTIDWLLGNCVLWISKWSATTKWEAWRSITQLGRRMSLSRLSTSPARTTLVMVMRHGGQKSSHETKMYKTIWARKTNQNKTKQNKTNSTRASHVVTHRTTDQARWDLTSQSGRDGV